MNKNTVYILQKDLPYVKAGVIYAKKSYWGFIGDDYTYFPDKTGMKHERFAIHADWVENNPEWFKPKEHVNESKPTEQFQWDENLAREFGDLCNQEGWHHFSGKKNIDTLLEQFKQSKSKTAPKEEQVPIKVSHITSHDAINFRDKTVYSHAVWVSQPIPESKYQPIREAIEDILNYEKCWVFPLIPKMGYRIELDALDIDFIKDQPQSLKEIIKMLKDKVVKSQRWYLAAMVRDLEKLVDNANKYNDKKYTESELLQARRDAFDAAREVVGYSDALKNSPVTVGRKYKDNEDYINSLNK